MIVDFKEASHACTGCFYIWYTIVGTNPWIYIEHFAEVVGVSNKLK